MWLWQWTNKPRIRFIILLVTGTKEARANHSGTIPYLNIVLRCILNRLLLRVATPWSWIWVNKNPNVVKHHSLLLYGPLCLSKMSKTWNNFSFSTFIFFKWLPKDSLLKTNGSCFWKRDRWKVCISFMFPLLCYPSLLLHCLPNY